MCVIHESTAIYLREKRLIHRDDESSQFNLCVIFLTTMEAGSHRYNSSSSKRKCGGNTSEKKQKKKKQLAHKSGQQLCIECASN